MHCTLTELRRASDSSSSPFTARSRDARQRPPSLIDVRLDPAQRVAVERPVGQSLLALGEAGHGKTTVALHRLAYLWRTSPVALRAAVVVPNEGLARLLQPLLRRLGVDLEVLTYDRFASARARRAFRRLPRESDSTPPSVMRLKRHPALRIALLEMAARDAGRIDDDLDAPQRRTGRTVSRGDLQHLFGDRVLLDRVAAAGGLSPLTVTDTLDRTRVQFARTTEDEWAHVTDHERLVAVDARALDDGTATEHAATLDVEDYAVLVELDALRARRRGHAPSLKPRYDVILVDEAQDLAPLELALVGRSLAPGGTLIVAGDAHQQTDATSTFLGWPSAMQELGCAHFEIVELDVGYRCPPDVARLARTLRDPSRASAARKDVWVHPFDSLTTLTGWLACGLRAVTRRDRGASVAVVCRSPMTARRVAQLLQAEEVAARLVFDGRFLLRGPVQVSTVEEVKGLEFDFVVIPDACALDYPDEPASCRAMYVAVTRARHQVVLACAGKESPLLLRVDVG